MEHLYSYVVKVFLCEHCMLSSCHRASEALTLTVSKQCTLYRRVLRLLLQMQAMCAGGEARQQYCTRKDAKSWVKTRPRDPIS